MACTTLLVGKKASYDGSTMTARNEDSGNGAYSPKTFIVVEPKDQPRHYTSVISKQEIDLPDNPMRYTAMPNAYEGEGLWSAAGVNAANVSMTATETITSNELVLSADPLMPSPYGQKEPTGGIGEEDLVTLTLPYIHSAREGVERLGMLHETYGTYETNGIAFQDIDEIWWFETIGGHHWMAVRVPDDKYVVMPNQLGIDYFDFEDAYGEKKNFMCSSDLKEFTEKYHLNTNKGAFNPRNAYGSHSDSDHAYNTPRAWDIERYFNPTTYNWYGENADYKPEDDNLPFALVPEKLITVEDVKYALSLHYNGTQYDPYGKYGDKSERGKYRPIGINRNNFLSCVQLRPYVPAEIMAVEWIAYSSNVFNAFVPFYANINKTPDYMKTGALVDTNDFYWANRLIAAMADASMPTCITFIERYQKNVQTKGHWYINQYDEKFISSKDITLLETANQEIADYVKTATDKCLRQVLDQRSNEMKNKYARSDA